MNDLPDLETLKSLYRKYVGEIEDEPEWRRLTGSAIYRKHTGDLSGAIEAMVKAIGLTRAVPNLAKETATNLNYLADLYLLKDAQEQAEEALRESIELSRPRYPGLLAANLWSLAGIQTRKGEHREALALAEESRRLSQQEGHSYGVAQAEELIERIKMNSGPLTE